MQRDVDPAKQRELQQLQIALVTGGQLGANAERLRETGEAGRGAAADQLEDVGIALLRHDRGAGRERIRKLEESELLRVEQQHVGRKAAEILHEQRDFEQQLRFGLAARKLHGGDWLVD